MSKIVVCPDSFKGSLSAEEVAEQISLNLKSLIPAAEILRLPLADGGEGSALALKSKFPIEKKVVAHDPLMRSIHSFYQSGLNEKAVLIESARVIGLTLLQPEERNPLKASSHGLGEVILEAIKNGANEIYISLGGSGVCDGGMGMLSALGFKFFDIYDIELIGNGENLRKISKINYPENYSAFDGIKFTAICDVSNPLYGLNGAACVYAPQKGATYEEVKILDEGLRNLDKKAKALNKIATNCSYREGAGAAGGIGYAVNSLLNGRLISGSDFILEALNFEDEIKNSSLIITGEGKIDRQSLMGKVLSGVLIRANALEIPVYALAGIVEDKDLILKSGVKELYEISDPSYSIDENMTKEKTIENIRRTVKNMSKSTIFQQLF